MRMHRTITSALLATYGLGLFLMPLQALAAPPGTLDGSFAYELTADAARKNTIATQSTGKIRVRCSSRHSDNIRSSLWNAILTLIGLYALGVATEKPGN